MKNYKYNLNFELNDKSRITCCDHCPVGKYDDMEDVECCKMFGCETSDISVPNECLLVEKRND